jgi:hypothetical protein
MLLVCRGGFVKADPKPVASLILQFEYLSSRVVSVKRKIVRKVRLGQLAQEN